MNRKPTAQQSNENISIPRNPDGALTSFDFLNKTQSQQLESLQTDAINHCCLLIPYYTANRKKNLEGVSLSILDVHLTDGKVDGFIARANAYVMNHSARSTRHEPKFFLATRNGTNIEVRQLPSGICATRAKKNIGLGLLAGHYLSQATEAAAPMKGFSILLEKGRQIGNGFYPLHPAIPRQEIIDQTVRLWQIASQRE